MKSISSEVAHICIIIMVATYFPWYLMQSVSIQRRAGGVPGGNYSLILTTLPGLR
jgi:hypothetical protein